MNTLNAIQILDIQDLVKAQIDSLYKKLDGSKYNDIKQMLISEIKRMEDADKKLDFMFSYAIENEG